MSKEFLIYLATIAPLIGSVAWIIQDYTKLKLEVQHNTETDQKERQEMKENIKELYESRNRINEILTEQIAKLTGQLSTLTQVTTNQLNNLEKKIDEIKYERKRNESH